MHYTSLILLFDQFLCIIFLLYYIHLVSKIQIITNKDLRFLGLENEDPAWSKFGIIDTVLLYTPLVSKSSYYQFRAVAKWF